MMNKRLLEITKATILQCASSSFAFEDVESNLYDFVVTDGSYNLRYGVKVENDGFEKTSEYKYYLRLLEDAKLKLIWKGLIHLYRIDDDNSRKFQIVLRLLEKFGEVSIQEYQYVIYYSLENSTTDFEAISNSIQDRRDRGIQDEVYSWNSRANNYEPTKDTATSYLKDLLRAANLLKDIDSGKITASDQFSSFMSMINQ